MCFDCITFNLFQLVATYSVILFSSTESSSFTPGGGFFLSSAYSFQSLVFLCKPWKPRVLQRNNSFPNEWVCHLILDTPPISLELPTYIVCVLTSSENCEFSREGTESSSLTQGGGFFSRSSAYSFLSQLPSLMSYEMFSYLDCG